ncbi:hypothetical protein LS178_001622 [Salmonella enterica]|nr:hypothetical protein [Salmonella enterica]
MLRKILFLISIFVIGYFGYQLYGLARDPYFSIENSINNIYFIISMFFFSYVLFFMENAEVRNILKGYYSSFNIKHVAKNNYSFGSLFCWLFLAYFHYHLLTLILNVIFMQIYFAPLFTEDVTVQLISYINITYGLVVRIIILYPLPFIFLKILKDKG